MMLYFAAYKVYVFSLKISLSVIPLPFFPRLADDIFATTRKLLQVRFLLQEETQ